MSHARLKIPLTTRPPSRPVARATRAATADAATPDSALDVSLTELIAGLNALLVYLDIDPAILLDDDGNALVDENGNLIIG